jgi:Spy/CpxP family protein refolding chaperone
MKNRAKWRAKSLIVALAMTGVAGGVYAQTAGSTSTAAAAGSTAVGNHKHWGHHGGGMMGGFMMHALHQLSLTDAQQQSVHSILASARAEAIALRQSAGTPNFAAWANPGDPNHGEALQEMQTRMAARIAARDAVQQQIYGVLTQEQKTQLASIIAARQAKMAQHGAS